MAEDKLAKALDITPMTQTINVPAKRHDVDSDEQWFADLAQKICNLLNR